MTRKRVAILISGRGSNMAALIEAAKAADYPAEIALVLSNVPDAAGLARAGEAGIAAEAIDHKPFGKDREAFDRQLNARLEAHRIDIVCLAGFMRVLSPWFVARWNGRLINIHPSLAACLQGSPHPRARHRGWSKRARCDGAFRGAGTRFGSDHRTRERAGASRRYARAACRPRARGGAPHLSPRAKARRRRRRLSFAKIKPPAARPGATGFEARACSGRPPQATLRFSAELFPRLLTSSYSTV